MYLHDRIMWEWETYARTQLQYDIYSQSEVPHTQYMNFI